MFNRPLSTSSYTVGSILDNRYRLNEKIGEGGAGIIYKATDEQLGRVVAIKLLTAGAGMTADKQERFRSEARSVARLNHPNIVTLYDYADTQDHPYLVMEYIPGQDLWALDNNYAPNLMPFEQSLTIMDSILAALEYSHAHGVIHRDLKPENVMITPDRQVKVMDFGLARVQGQSRLTQEGLVAGTASYLAPELALGEVGDHRVDLYAAGVMMYELFTGRRPFSGDDPLTIISQHIHAPVVPPQRYNSAIPDMLQAIILTLLAKQPEDRYLDAGRVRQELAPVQAFLEGDRAAAITDIYQISETLSVESSASHQVLLDRIARGKIVGREEELGELKRRWDLARLGDFGAEPLVLISGEAGIGKTRLLRELEVYANLRDGTVLHNVAREQDVGTPYIVFAGALRDYVRRQPAEVLRRQVPGFIAGEVVKLAPQLAEKIGPISPNPPLEPESERARLLEQISNFILNIVLEQPTLLLLDDLQFADPGSLDILQTLARRSGKAAVMVVGAYRDVALGFAHPINNLTPALSSAHLLYPLPLRRLSLIGVEQMLHALLGDSVSESFVASIYQASEGNPLFVEEVVKSLAVDGQIKLEDGHWTQRDADRLNVPGSIKSVLGGRLGQVAKSTLELLQLAAVIGRNFTLDLLSAIDWQEEEITQWAIEEALRFQLIEVSHIFDQPESSTGSAVNVGYQFQHALIRETLYEELRPLRRRRLHRKVALALEKLIAEQRLELKPAVLARHFIAAAQEERAVPYLRQAGQAASEVFANVEAVDYLNQAREILQDIGLDLTGQNQRKNLVEQFELLSRERRILNVISEPDRELQALQELQNLAETLHDKKRWVQVMARLGAYYWQIGRLSQAETTVRQALEVAQQQNDRPGRLQCLEQIARIFWTRRDAAGMTFASEALELARELGDRHREGRLTELVGSIYTDTYHDIEQAAHYFKQALEICREIGNRYEEAWTLWGMGRLALLVDDYTGALERYGAAKQISEDIGSTLQVGWDLYLMGDAWYNLGDYETALDHYWQAQAIFNSAQHLRGKINGLISLGLTYAVQNQPDEAGSYLERAKQQAEDRNDLLLMLRSYEALATHNRALGGTENLVNIVRLGNRVIQLAGEGGYFEHELLGYFLRGLGFFALGDAERAYKSSAVAVERLEKLTHLHSPQIQEAEIFFEHSRILADLGQTVAAQAYLQKAYAETMRKANFIVDDQQYQDFLKIPLNREIVETMAGQI